MCVLLITRLLRGVGRWARKPVNHTSWVAVITPTDRPKSVRNCRLIELFCGVVCVATLPLGHFCWYRGFCHRTGSDLLLFVFVILSYFNAISLDFYAVKCLIYINFVEREKEGDLTQSYDKTPYTNRKFENQRTTHTNATKNFDYTTIADRLRTVSWSNK